MEESQKSNEEKKFKLLSPKIDVVFQALFGEVGNERITKKFLENIMNRKIESHLKGLAHIGAVAAQGQLVL